MIFIISFIDGPDNPDNLIHMIDVPFSYLRFLPRDFTDWSEEVQQKWLDQFRIRQREKQTEYRKRKREENPDYDEEQREYRRQYYADNKKKFEEANKRYLARKEKAMWEHKLKEYLALPPEEQENQASLRFELKARALL